MNSSHSAIPVRSPGIRIALRALLLVCGYITAIVASAFLYAVLLSIYGLAVDWHRWEWPNFGLYFLLSAYFGSFLGLPYTILGSLLVQFILPRSKVVFLFVGMFCPATALMLLYWDDWDNDLPHMLLLSFPPGLVAAYLYGAIGFGYGFKRWQIK